MSENSDYSELIRRSTIPIWQVDEPRANVFQWLSQSIIDGKAKLENNTVDFLIAKILKKNGRLYSLERTNSFDLYVLGRFRSNFIPAESVAKALADFYLEINILPIIHPVTKSEFIENKKMYLNKLRGGVLLYERR